MTDTTMQQVAQEAAAIAPVASLAANAAGQPQVALALQLAPAAITAMQALLTLANAGALTPEQLAAQYLTIAQGIQASHNAWAAQQTA